ncbi:hypothetical protein HaLaN_01155, partial [Haematococcus lacustris]
MSRGTNAKSRSRLLSDSEEEAHNPYVSQDKGKAARRMLAGSDSSSDCEGDPRSALASRQPPGQGQGPSSAATAAARKLVQSSGSSEEDKPQRATQPSQPRPNADSRSRAHKAPKLDSSSVPPPRPTTPPRSHASMSAPAGSSDSSPTAAAAPSGTGPQATGQHHSGGRGGGRTASRDSRHAVPPGGESAKRSAPGLGMPARLPGATTVLPLAGSGTSSAASATLRWNRPPSASSAHSQKSKHASNRDDSTPLISPAGD